MSVTTLFFLLLFLVLLMGLRIRGFLWTVMFFGIFAVILIKCDPRGDEKVLAATICVQKDERNGRDDLFLEYEDYRHHITQDSYLHSWGCIQEGDSIHVYLTKDFQYKNLIYSVSPEFVLVKEED